MIASKVRKSEEVWRESVFWGERVDVLVDRVVNAFQDFFDGQCLPKVFSDGLGTKINKFLKDLTMRDAWRRLGSRF